MADIKIKDVPLVGTITGLEKIPVSNGSGKPVAITVLLILDMTSQNSAPLANGIQIVETEAELGTLDLPVGSIVSVGKQGYIGEMKPSEMFQPDASIMDMNTYTINTEGLEPFLGVNIVLPNGLTEGTETSIMACTSNMNMIGSGGGAIAGITIITETDSSGVTYIAGVGGMVQNASTGEQLQYMLCTVAEDGTVTMNQTDIDAFNAYISDYEMFYLGMFDNVMTGKPIEAIQLATADAAIRVISGVATKSDVYVKGDTWEKVDYKQIPKLKNEMEELKENTNYPIKELNSTSYSYSLSPNVYNRLVIPIDRMDKYSFYLMSPSNDQQLNEYVLELDCMQQIVSFSLPSDIKWVNNEIPAFVVGKKYIISIVNKLGAWAEF